MIKEVIRGAAQAGALYLVARSAVHFANTHTRKEDLRYFTKFRPHWQPEEPFRFTEDGTCDIDVPTGLDVIIVDQQVRREDPDRRAKDIARIFHIEWFSRARVEIPQPDGTSEIQIISPDNPEFEAPGIGTFRWYNDNTRIPY